MGNSDHGTTYTYTAFRVDSGRPVCAATVSLSASRMPCQCVRYASLLNTSRLFRGLGVRFGVHLPCISRGNMTNFQYILKNRIEFRFKSGPCSLLSGRSSSPARTIHDLTGWVRGTNRATVSLPVSRMPCQCVRYASLLNTSRLCRTSLQHYLSNAEAVHKKRFRGGLAFKARRLLYHSTLGRE